MFHLDQLSRLESTVLDKALEDRHRFDKIYQLIEKYASDHKLVVGGTISIKAVTNTSKDQYDYQYIIYTENPYKDGINISNLCADVTDATVMRTEIYGKELAIRVYDRPLVTLICLDKNMREIIRPLLISDQLYVPPDFHLLQTYRNLYMPTDLWEESIKNESKLYGWLRKEYSRNQKKFIGASDDGAFRHTKNELKTQLLTYLSDRKDIILVGAYAYNILVDETGDANVEILGTDSIADELNAWIQNKTKLATSVKKSNVQLISDFRLNRTTIFIVHQSNKIPVLFIYNSLEYDLVPYNKTNKSSIFCGQIGNPFVLMRYILIDIWIIKVIRVFGGIDEEFAKNKILDSYERLFNIRDKLKLDNVQVKAEDNLWSIFQPADDSRYIGQYLSDITARKTIIKAQDFTPDYLPIRYKREHGNYQTIANKNKK